MPGEKPLGARKNQQQTQPTYDAGTGIRTRATMVGGECCHHCTTPAPQIPNSKFQLYTKAVIDAVTNELKMLDGFYGGRRRLYPHMKCLA